MRANAMTENLIEVARKAAQGWDDILKDFHDRCAHLEIDSDSMRVKALNGIAWSKDQKKKIDAKRKSITAPGNTIVRNANAEFKPQMESCQLIADALATKIRIYDQRRALDVAQQQAELDATVARDHRARVESLEKSADMLEEEGCDATEVERLRRQATDLRPVDIVAMEPAKAKVAGITEREVWNVIIEDLEKVPMEFCEKVPRLKQLLDRCREKSGDVEIPGVHFEKVTSFAGR